jgi:hypothetical protein
MTNPNRDKGMILPDTIDPGDVVCARVYIPDDSLYIAAFWQVYQSLTTWLVWERGGTRAKQAADVWKAAYDMARLEWVAGSGCGIMDVRQKPDAPCILQKRVGSEWEDFADLRLCVPKLRLYGGKVQQDTTGSGDWQDASETGDFDQKNGGEYNPQWETVPEGETAECLSSRNVALMLNYTIATFCGTWAGAEGFAGALAFLVGFAAAWLSDGIAAPLFALIDTLALWEFNQFANAGAMVLTDDLTELMACLYSEDGTMTPANHATLLSRFDDTIAGLSVDYEIVRWRFTKFYVQWLGPVGMTLAGKAWGIQSYDCERRCDVWEHTFDFSSGAQGWESQDVDWSPEAILSNGAWHETSGVRSGYCDGYRQRKCNIRIFETIPELTRIDVYYDAAIGAQECDGVFIYLVPYSSVTDGRGTLVELESGTGNIATLAGQWNSNGAAVAFQVGSKAAGEEPGGSCAITKIVLAGFGEDPF